MASHPFTIVRGGGGKKPPPEAFARFDERRAIGDRMMARFYGDRDKAIDKLRATHKLP